LSKCFLTLKSLLKLERPSFTHASSIHSWEDNLGLTQTLTLHRQRAFAAHFPHVETANAGDELLHSIQHLAAGRVVCGELPSKLAEPRSAVF